MTRTTALDCEEALRRLFEYIDAELVEDQRQEVDRHLSRCRSCFSRFEFERRIKEHVAALGSVEPPPLLHQRIRSMIDDFRT